MTDDRDVNPPSASPDRVQIAHQRLAHARRMVDAVARESVAARRAATDAARAAAAVGVPLPEIARRLGVSEGTVARMVGVSR